MTEIAASSAPADAGAEEEGYSDRLLAEVQLDKAPALLAFHQLDRRRRADLARRVAQITPRLEHVEALIHPQRIGSLATVAGAADVVEFMADVEDLIASAAVDKDGFRAWAATASDVELLALFARWARSLSAGEASSSSS